MRPVGDPRQVGDFSVQYLDLKDHDHEGGHQVAIEGSVLTVLPDGRTTAKKRSHTLSEALHSAAALSLTGQHALDMVVGHLVRAGATNLLIEDVPLPLASPGRVIAHLNFQAVLEGDELTWKVTDLGAGA